MIRVYKIFRSGIFILLLFINIQSIYSQCPEFTSSSMVADCSSPGPVCNLCVDEVITLLAAGTDLPEGQCVKWYYSSTSGFNPYDGEGTLFDCGVVSSGVVGNVTITITNLMCDQDIYIVGIVDPLFIGCSEVFTNEFKIHVTCPVADFTMSPSLTDLCPYQTFNFFGEGGISYQWSGPFGFSSDLQNPSVVPTNNPTFDSHGTYTVTVTDAYGCTDTKSIEIPELDFPDPIYDPDEPFGDYFFCGTNPQITYLEAIGGGLDWIFKGWATWNPISNPETIFQLYPTLNIPYEGPFWILLETSTGCQVIDRVDIWLTPMEVGIFPSNEIITCPGSSTTVTAYANGVPPYTFEWSTGATTHSIVIDEVGEFYVTITDADGCQGIDTVTSIAGNIIINILGNYDFCVGQDNIITATGSMGTAPYTYEWVTPTGFFNGTTINANVGGLYTVIVTDADGCSSTKSFNVASSNLAVSIFPDPHKICLSGSPVTANATGGSGTGYNYKWTTPGGIFFGQSINSSGPGIYSVVVTDSEGCTSMDEAEFTAYDPIVVTINPDPAALCLGETITLTNNVTGGNPSYTYTWVSPTGDDDTKEILASIPGKYYLTVTDAQGCMGFDEIEVTESDSFLIEISSVPTDFCNADTIILFTNINGINNDYIWETPNGQYFTDTISSTLAGNYSVTVISKSGCKGSATFTIKEGGKPDIKLISSNSVLCQNDSLVITANSNDLNIVSYNWVTPNGVKTGKSIYADSIGNYIVTIKNAGGCTAIDSITISPSPDIDLSASPDSSSVCSGGSILLTASSLTEPLTYKWIFKQDTLSSQSIAAKEEGVYIVNGINEFGCQISDSLTVLKGGDIEVSIGPDFPTICLGSTIKLTAQTTSSSAVTYNWSTPLGDKTGEEVIASALGIYTVTVTSTSGCTGVDTIEVKEGLPLLVITPANPGFCKGQGVDISALVSGKNLTYIWSTPKGTFNTPNVFADVIGIYSVTVSDEGGCSGTTSAEVVLYPDLDVVIDPNPASFCGSGSTKLTAISNNGEAPFNYEWATPAGSGSSEFYNANIEGSYNVTVTDSRGCTGISTSEVTKSNTLSISQSNPGFCPGTFIDVSVSPNGGEEPYSYNWETPIGDFTSEKVNTSTAGTYLVTVTDAGGCTGIGQLEVKEFSTPAIQLDPLFGFCSGLSVNINPIVTDPLSPLTYNWITPNGNFSSLNLTATEIGAYTFTSTNSEGCSSSSSTIVEQWELPQILIDPNQVSFCKGASIEVKGFSATGKAPYSYEWTGPGSSIDSLINITIAGVYNVNITDANGCSDITSFTASEEPGLNVSITTDPVLKCNISNYTVLPEVKGGNGIYSFSWQTPDGPQTSLSLNTSSYGVFALTVTDEKGCTGTSSLSVKDDNLYPELIKTDPYCSDPSSGFVEISNAANAVYPLGLTINGKNQTQINALPYKIQKLIADNYVFELTASNGCKYTESFTLNATATPVLELGDDVTIYLGESYTIMPKANFTIDSIYWNDTTYLVCEPGCLEPVVTPYINKEYKATAYSNDGCIAKDNIRIFVVEKSSVYVPNTFSPNGDGINDSWVILTDPTVTKITKMYIYDRWGESILILENFPPNDPDYGWNGKFRNKFVNSGVFVYYFEVEFKDGRKKIFKGDITLLR